MTLTVFAREISAEQSLRRAVEMICEKSYAKKVRSKVDFALLHTQKSTQNGKALYYVFRNERNGGFVITGADDRANSLLGYTENGTFDQALAIPAFRSWLSNCEAAMQWLSDKEDAPTQVNIPKFNLPDHVVTNADNAITLTIPGRHYIEDSTLPASVEPLLGGIAWNQNAPFNRLCPEIVVNGEKQKCATGCVATATAQVMKYWEWPKQGIGSNKYTSNKNGIEIDLEADFTQSVYDWGNMLDDYSEDFSDEQANAVAKLMSDVGIAEELWYGVPTTSGSHTDTSYALATYFGYNKGIQNCERAYYTYAEWNDLLKTELAQSRPVLMGGINMYEEEGHVFVLDGYDEDGNYHVNWGWGGMSNGYFDINYMNPEEQGIGGSTGGYPAKQQININCFPDVDGTSVAHYQMVVPTEVTLLPDNSLACRISNMGLASYSGQLGYIAMIDNDVVGKVAVDIDELPFTDIYHLRIPFDDLGVTPGMIGDKKCIIYPVYLEGDEYKVPLSQVSLQDYIMISVDTDGNIVSEVIPEDNATPICKSIEITRDYAGFNIKAKAVITNEDGHKDFYRQITMFVVDETKMLAAIGKNFAVVNAGETCEIEISCNPFLGDLEIGKTYNAYITYEARFENAVIPGSETTVTMKDPGAEPNLSYSDFALDKDVIASKEELTVSFNAKNTGGFGVEKFTIAVFKEGISQALDSHSVEADLPAGTTTVSKILKMNYDEGNYEIGVYTKNDDGNWKKITPKYLKFTIKALDTAITNITDDTNVSTPYYDLHGRRVANPTMGLYIMGNKKVVK